MRVRLIMITANRTHDIFVSCRCSAGAVFLSAPKIRVCITVLMNCDPADLVKFLPLTIAGVFF